MNKNGTGIGRKRVGNVSRFVRTQTDSKENQKDGEEKDQVGREKSGGGGRGGKRRPAKRGRAMQ